MRTGLTAAAAVLAVVLVGAGCSSPDDAPAPAPSPVATPSASPGARPTGAPTEQPTSDDRAADAADPQASAPTTTGEPPPVPTAPVATRTLPPVEVGDEAAFEGGLVATVAEVSPVDLEARGPGQVAGPGQAVVLELENGSSDDVDLAGLAVSATLADGAPAEPSSGPPAEPLTGTLAPGGSARGTFVFAAPQDAALRIQVEQNQLGDVVVVQS